VVIKDEFTELSNRPVFASFVGFEVDAILDAAGYFVFFVRSNRVLIDVFDGQICEAGFRSDTLLNSLGSDTSKLVAGFQFVCLPENIFYIFELILFRTICF
jgi:hypothetical protein